MDEAERKKIISKIDYVLGVLDRSYNIETEEQFLLVDRMLSEFTRNDIAWLLCKMRTPRIYYKKRDMNNRKRKITKKKDIKKKDINIRTKYTEIQINTNSIIKWITNIISKIIFII